VGWGEVVWGGVRWRGVVDSPGSSQQDYMATELVTIEGAVGGAISHPPVRSSHNR